MDINKFFELYWNYYNQLEEDFFSLEPYCAISKENNNTYSTKYLQLILSVCGEIDTICKRLCSCLDPSLNMDTAGINDYKKILMQHYPQIADEKVVFHRRIYREIWPFKSWASGNGLQWWSVYNKIKHHRDELWNNKESYKYANQKNAIEALSALYIILEYWAVYNFILPTQSSGSADMLALHSNQLLLTKWQTFYRNYFGFNSFEADLCRQYFTLPSEKVVSEV